MMKRPLPSLFLSLSSFVAAGAFAAGAEAPVSGTVKFAENIKPLLEQYCFDCHNADKRKGDVDLVKVTESTNFLEHHEVWEKVVEMLESGDMPPEKKPQPASAQREILLGFI